MLFRSCPVNPDLLTVIVVAPCAMPSNTALPVRLVTAERDAPDDGVTQTAAPEIGLDEVPTSTVRFASTGGGAGFTVSVALSLTPPVVAVIFTTVEEVTALVVTANVWVFEPAET